MFSESAYEAMQAAVDIVHQSPHPVNKIAATLFSPKFMLSRTNYWPPAIETVFGKDKQIGSSSGSIHAEMATLFDAAYPCKGAHLAVTDPPCPNCIKNIIEAGITHIYIDHKGFEKDFFQRRGQEFRELSLLMCEKAGIGVYKIFRKDRRFETLIAQNENKIAHEDSPIISEPIEEVTEAVFNDLVKRGYETHKERNFAIALVKAENDKLYALTARSHPVTGISFENHDDLELKDKYDLIQHPLNRIFMRAARDGLRFIDGYFFSSQVPTSREMVHLVGKGIKRITIGDPKKCRDPQGLEAMQMLSSAGVLSYT